MRTWPRIAARVAVLALAVAGCDSDSDDQDLGETEQGVVSVVPCAARGALNLYQGTNYTGVRLCLGGNGKYDLSGSWYHGVRSYKTGDYSGTLDTDDMLPPQGFVFRQSVPWASPSAQSASSICMTEGKPDAGAPTCP